MCNSVWPDPIRDVKFLTTLPDARDRQYGEGLRQALKDLFAVFHQRQGLPTAVFQGRLQAARQRVLHAGLSQVPPTRHSQNMAQRFRAARRGVLYLHHDAGDGADQQSGGTGDSLCGH